MNCTCLIGEFRRLRDDELPLLVSLAWSEERGNGLDCKQFVLKDSHSVLKDPRSADVEVCWSTVQHFATVLLL